MEKKIVKKILRGTVVSSKMTDSAVVEVSRFVKHPKYKKYLKTTSRFTVHNPGNAAKEGDVVTIRGCRPISKTKTWEVIVEQA